MQLSPKKKKIKELALDVVFLIVGSFLFAVSVNIFTAPNNIAAGGLTGAATMLNYLFGIPIGTAIILMNIPIFIWGILAVNWQFVAKTVAATLISSLMIDLTVGILPAYSGGDMLLVTIFGGVFAGLGLGLIFIRGATTGGTDMIATLLGKYFRHLSFGRLLLLVDMFIVVVSAFVYQNYVSPMYATIVIFITTKVVDAVLYGANAGTGKMMFIISPKNEEIAREIMEKLDRGVTKLHSNGCYSGQENGVLLCAVRRPEVHKTYDIIHTIDPDAFVIVGEAGEITGEGFHEIAGKQREAEENRRKKEARRAARAQKKEGRKKNRKQ